MSSLKVGSLSDEDNPSPANQYSQTLDEAAYIKSRLNGKARVVLLTHDSLHFLAPRFTAMRDSFRSNPGVVIVADISPLTVDEAGGSSMMRTILLANPELGGLDIRRLLARA